MPQMYCKYIILLVLFLNIKGLTLPECPAQLNSFWGWTYQTCCYADTATGSVTEAQRESACSSASSFSWFPSDPNMCCLKLPCPGSLAVPWPYNDDGCCYAYFAAESGWGEADRKKTCDDDAAFTWVPLDYNSNFYTCCVAPTASPTTPPPTTPPPTTPPPTPCPTTIRSGCRIAGPVCLSTEKQISFTLTSGTPDMGCGDYVCQRCSLSGHSVAENADNYGNYYNLFYGLKFYQIFIGTILALFLILMICLFYYFSVVKHLNNGVQFEKVDCNDSDSEIYE